MHILLIIVSNCYYVSYLYTEVGTYCFTPVRSVCLSLCCESPIHFSPAIYIVQAVKHETLTRCWANVGPPSTTLTQHSPILGYRVVFGATLNVGQRHRRWANINPALVHSVVPILPACRYQQHEVLTIGLNGYWPAPATLAQHLTDIGSVSVCNHRQQ